MTNTKFPLISDNEAIFSEVPHMDLYDEFDFISNIKGDYQEKTFADSSSSSKTVAQPIPSSQSEKRKQVIADKVNQSISPKVQEKSYAEVAREEARADLKKKRSASYLTSDAVSKKHRSKIGFSARKSTATKAQPTAFFQKENPGEFAKYGQHLKQEDYIVADLSAEPVVQVEAPKTEKKNNYDFLKTSQVYNKKELRDKKENKVAAELNLTRFDQA